MCTHTYHHYPSCGHISNWSMTSCQEYTNRLRLSCPSPSSPCEAIETSHDLLQSTQPDMCIQCERDWGASISSKTPSPPYQVIEGLNQDSPLVEINARMVTSCNDRDSQSAGHSDNGRISASAVNDRDVRNTNHSDNDWFFAGAVEHDIDHSDSFLHDLEKRIADLFNCSTEMECESVTFGIELSPFNSCADFDISDGASDSETETISYPEFIYAPAPNVPAIEEEWDELNDEIFGLQNALLEIKPKPKPKPKSKGKNRDKGKHKSTLTEFNIHDSKALFADCSDSDPEPDSEPESQPEQPEPAECHNSPYNLSTDPEIDILLIQRRIEATIHKRLAENTEKQTRQQTITKLLDAALLQKDQDQRSRPEPEIHWDEMSLEDLFTAEAKYQDKGQGHGQEAHASRYQPPAQMHTYHGTMFAATQSEAHALGLRRIKPYLDYEGEWEGLMQGFSVDEVNRMGLLDAIHVRGCCEQRPAESHLYYGFVEAESEAAAEEYLEDVRPEWGRYYGVIEADDEAKAVVLGVQGLRHLWGCCVDGDFELPVARRHAYVGCMAGLGVRDVIARGLRDPVEVREGVFCGFVVGSCELEVWRLGLRDIEHAFCCEGEGGGDERVVDDAHDAFSSDISHSEVVDRLPALIPGSSMGHSFLQVGMGLPCGA